MKKALLVVDVQNDFCEGGALAVPDANSIIPYINNLIHKGKFDEIIFSQDFHPKDHISFAEHYNGKNVGDFIELPNGKKQILWPTHCVEETKGSEFHQDLSFPEHVTVVQKGMHKMVDSYSAFFDNNQEFSTGLTDYLISKNINQLEIVGLALDYCVKFSALDAQKEGFHTSVHFRGTKAVNINPDDADKTILELINKGINIIA